MQYRVGEREALRGLLRSLARACAARRRTACTNGSNSPSALGANHTIAAPITSTSSTAPIMSTAIAEPSGQFCAWLNCDAIIAPIMLPFAPPSTVAVT